MTTKLFTAVMGTALLALAGCQSTQDKTPADTLVATFTSAAPNMAAGASDPVWAKAPSRCRPI
jgi:predicted component of type VI protein secretion system